MKKKSSFIFIFSVLTCLFLSFGVYAQDEAPNESEQNLQTQTENQAPSVPTTPAKKVSKKQSNTKKQETTTQAPTNNAQNIPTETETTAPTPPSQEKLITQEEPLKEKKTEAKTEDTRKTSPGPVQGPAKQATENLDLPEVTQDEIDLPKPVSAQDAENLVISRNIWPGIIAWGLIAVGLAIVIFILFSNRKSGDLELCKKTKRRKKGSRLLPDRYYRDIGRF